MALKPQHAPGSTKVVTGEVRLSYVHLYEKFSNIEGAPPKYSVVLLVPKTDKATIAAIEAAQQVALEAGKSKVFGGKIPPNWKNTFRDGDDEGDLEKNPEVAGHMFMTVSTDRKPGVVNRDTTPAEEADVYSGCYARVSINAFAFSKSGNKGVSFGLQHVQKIRDGESLGGITRAEDDFDALPDDGEDEGESLI